MVIRFGDFNLNLVSGDLFRDRRLIGLKPQPTKLLVALASQPGLLVTREQIRERIWGQQIHIDYENGINSCVGQLRRVLDDNSRNSRYIQTESRRGYRFIAPVNALDCETHSMAAALERASREPDGVLKVQVRPFRDISCGGEWPQLLEGLTEELLDQLVRSCRGNIIVIDDRCEGPATSHDAFILKGTVRHEGRRLRIAVRVVSASDNQVVWTETLERELVSILDFQLEVARWLARAVAEFACL